MADPIQTTPPTQPNSNPNLQGIGSNALGVYQGLNRGGAYGDASAAASAAKLAGASGAFSQGTSSALKGYGGAAGNALGIYSGIQQGGVAGYSGAAVNAAQLGAASGAFGAASPALGAAAGYAAVPLAIYNEVNSWESGKTGQDAIGGASSGAAVGTLIMPGIGTAVGAVVGALAGALSSAFGPGAVDPENANFEQFTHVYNKAATPQEKGAIAASAKNPYLPLAGYFDLRPQQLKGQNPLYQRYGRKGEQKFTNDLVRGVQKAQAAGIKDPNQMWNKVVQPWLNSMGTWQDSNKDAITGLIHNMTGQIMNGNYQQNFRAIGGDTPFARPGTQPSPGSLAALPGAMRRTLPVRAGARPV